MFYFLPDGVPGFEHCQHIIWLGFKAKLALGDDSPIRKQMSPYLLNGLLNLLSRPLGEKLLAVNLSPESDLSAKPLTQFFHSHAEDLAVQGIDSDFD